MTIRINVLCGTKTIGGNKILLGYGKRNVLLDFGLDFSVTKRYFDSFLNPRGSRGIHDYIDFGLLPKLGIYRDDQVTDDCLQWYQGFPKVKVDALLISHAFFVSPFISSCVSGIPTSFT